LATRDFEIKVICKKTHSGRCARKEKQMKPSPCHWSEVFPGGVPGWIIFGMQVEDIQYYFASDLFPEEESHRYQSLAEVSFIGLIAYFEGFVKYHFASIINICPRLLVEFSRKRPDVSIPITDLSCLSNINAHIGFAVADRFPFSAPKEINGLFRDLMLSTPFSKDEQRRYDQILHDRHQIVHSASLYTSQYLRAKNIASPKDERFAYFQGVSINKDQLLDDAKFLLSMAEKIVNLSHAYLLRDDSWESTDEKEMMNHTISFMEWNEHAFSEPDDSLFE
jgi:hypothetical protein